MAPPDKAQPKKLASKKKVNAQKGKAGVRKKARKGGTADSKKCAAPRDAGPDYGPPLRKQGVFEKDLPLMMFGYGDVRPPARETVSLVEEIVVDYASALLQKASDQALQRGSKMQAEDILFVVRKDPMKFARAKELLSLNEEIKAARKGFEEQDTAFMDE